MIGIYEISSTGKRLISRFPTYPAAEKAARENYPVKFLEKDAKYANCADFITALGVQYAIEPTDGAREGFATKK